MAKTLKDLALALLNATLMLIALCLILALLVLGKAQDLAGRFSETVALVTPLQDRLDDTRAELAGLRTDLAALGDETTSATSQAVQRVQTRVDALNDRLAGFDDALIRMRDSPEQLIDYTIEAAGREVSERVAAFRGCVPPQ